MMKTTFELGPIRPPSESNSLLLRVTENCSWNKCKFCSLYREEHFRVRQVEDIKSDIDVMKFYENRIRSHADGSGRISGTTLKADMASFSYPEQNAYYTVYNWLVNGGENVFLQDANTVVLKASALEEVLLYLKAQFPHIKRITSYGRAESIAKISLEDLKKLKVAGLNRIHSGFESGSDKVLTMINKGCTAAEEIEAGLKVKEAGIELSVYFMPGVGGKSLWKENAIETAKVINAINPDFLRLRTFVPKEGTELGKATKEGTFMQLSDKEKVIEIKELITHIEGCTGTLTSDHIINLLEEVTGNLTEDKQAMLNTIDQFLNLSNEEQKHYQLARRMGLVRGLGGLATLSQDQHNEIKKISCLYDEEDAWEAYIQTILNHYI